MSRTIGAYRNLAGALVTIVEIPDEGETEAECQGFGCRASELFEWLRVSGSHEDGTYFEIDRQDLAHQDARAWAQEHASWCRAVPRQEVQS